MFENNYQDIELTCSDCNSTFVFSAEEQEFYAEKGFASPKRCPVCRANRKKQRNASRKRYPAKCSKCGCDTTVPFKPREDKEIYCTDCYAAMKAQQQEQAPIEEAPAEEALVQQEQ